MTKKIETVTVDFDNLNHMISCKMRLPSKYAFRNALAPKPQNPRLRNLFY